MDACIRMQESQRATLNIADIDDHTLVLILQKLHPLDRFTASSVCKVLSSYAPCPVCSVTDSSVF